MKQLSHPAYFEDFRTGAVYDCGEYLMSEEEILDFARRYDPQPFHADPVAAQDSVFGGLIASGWHTAAVMMRMAVEHFIPRESSMGSPGVDELRWLRPVRPGDRLRVRATVLETRRLVSKPDRGVVRARFEVFVGDELAMISVGSGFYGCRDAAPPQD